MFPPKKNTTYIFYIGLKSQANPNVLQSNPTLAAGDVKISIDGSALQNLTTLPDVDPNNSKAVKVTIDGATEMTGDNINIIFSDAAGDEWCDLLINVQPNTYSIDGINLAAINGTTVNGDGSGTPWGP